MVNNSAHAADFVPRAQPQTNKLLQAHECGIPFRNEERSATSANRPTNPKTKPAKNIARTRNEWLQPNQNEPPRQQKPRAIQLYQRTAPTEAKSDSLNQRTAKPTTHSHPNKRIILIPKQGAIRCIYGPPNRLRTSSSPQKCNACK